jgi:hypothetical protein
MLSTGYLIMQLSRIRGTLPFFAASNSGAAVYGLLGLRMRFLLVGRNIGDINGHCAIDAGVRYASGTMVVRDGLNCKVGQAPQSEQVCAYLHV